VKNRFQNSPFKYNLQRYAAAFDRWAEMVQEQKEMRVLLKRAAMKVHKRQMAAAYAKVGGLYSYRIQFTRSA
jgi:hypothetical protein